MTQIKADVFAILGALRCFSRYFNGTHSVENDSSNVEAWENDSSNVGCVISKVTLGSSNFFLMKS